MHNKQTVAVIGSSSLVGAPLIRQLCESYTKVISFSRNPASHHHDKVKAVRVDEQVMNTFSETISQWVCVAPIWVLSEYLPMLERCGVTNIVALSSTSVLSKSDSSDPSEQETVYRLKTAEESLQSWAGERELSCTILRPTLIYGYGRDKNISEIARFIRRFHIFPLLGRGQGLRQPVHADDVAMACVKALCYTGTTPQAFSVSGADTISYREMVSRIFITVGKRPRFIRIPVWLFASLIAVARLLPRYRHWSISMAQRMSKNLVYPYLEAEEQLGYKPRAFQPTGEDIGESAL